MIDEFKNVISIAGLSVFGKNTNSEYDIQDWDQLIQYSCEQTVLPLVWQSLKRTHICPTEACNSVEMLAMPMVIEYFLQKEAIINLLAQAEKEGIRTFILKGFVIAESYAEPDARISGDTDILIDKADESAMLHFLKQNSFTAYPREKGKHHTICVHPRLGQIELHIDFFSEYDQETWLRSIKIEDSLSWHPHKQISPQGEYWTIDPTSHMTFIYLHMLNHFVKTGASLRMFFDVAAFYRSNYDLIDLERFQNVIKKTNGTMLFSAILTVCEKYCGVIFYSADNNVNDEIVVKILDDLKKGGCNGSKEMLKRQLERNENTRLKVQQDNGGLKYYLHIIKYYLLRLRGLLFPMWSELLLTDPLLSSKKYRIFSAWFFLFRYRVKNYYFRKRNIRSIMVDYARMQLLIDCGLIK